MLLVHAEHVVNGPLDHLVKIRPRPRANYDRRIDVAFICTGNICRSPMAEAMLRARLAKLRPPVEVGSAGLLFDGRPAEPNAVKVMAKRGLDVSDHKARKISADLLAGTSLIIGMERKHIREVATLDTSLFARSFTLPEIVHLASLVGARQKGQRLRDWAEHIGNLRDPVEYARSDRASEIRDPMGGSVRAFRTCADVIDLRLAQLVDLAWPRPQPSDREVAPATPGGIHADRNRR